MAIFEDFKDKKYCCCSVCYLLLSDLQYLYISIINSAVHKAFFAVRVVTTPLMYLSLHSSCNLFLEPSTSTELIKYVARIQKPEKKK